MEHIVITGIFSFPTGEAASSRVRNFALAFKQNSYQPYIFSTTGRHSGPRINHKGFTLYRTDDDLLYKPLFVPPKNESGFITRLTTSFIYPIVMIFLGLKAARFAKKNHSKIIFVYGRSYILATSLFWFRELFYKEAKIITDITEPPYDYQRNLFIDPFRWQNLFRASIRIKLLDSLLFFRNLHFFDLVIFISLGLENSFSDKIKNKIVIPSILYTNNRRLEEKKTVSFSEIPKLLYLGAFFDKDDPEKMFALLSSLKDTLEEYEIWLAGKFMNKESEYWISKYTTFFGRHLKVFDSPDDQQLREIISNSSFMICMRQESILQQFTFPTRVVECLAHEKPIISNAFGDISLYFVNDQNAILIISELCSDEFYFQSILKKYSERKKYDFIIENSQKLLLTTFSADYNVKRILEIV
jgi:glycosyltransferase involved in cell wall biosynthesis